MPTDRSQVADSISSPLPFRFSKANILTGTFAPAAVLSVMRHSYVGR